MRITHVKITSGKGVRIKYSKPSGEDWESYDINCPEAPLPAFTDAMDALKPFVIKAKGLSLQPDDIRLEVNGISISYKGETTEKFCVMANCSEMGAIAPECYNTALRTLIAPEQTPDQVGEDIRKLVDNIKLQAEAYINGSRAQQELHMKSEEPIVKKRGRKKASNIEDFPAEEGEAF